MMFPLVFSAFVDQPTIPIRVDYRSGSGLFISAGDVQLVRGSFFQYYKGNWEKGYYSSNWTAQQVSRKADGTVVVTFGGKGDRASGEFTFTPVAEGVRARYEFRWSGTEPVNVESTIGNVWAAPFAQGETFIACKPGVSLATPRKMTDDPDTRVLGPLSNSVELRSAYGSITISTPRKDLSAFDARGYNQDWAEGKDLVWFGFPRVEIPAGGSVVLDALISIQARPVHAGQRKSKTLTGHSGIVRQPSDPPVLIPRPKEMNLAEGRVLTLKFNKKKVVPAAIRDLTARFESSALDPGQFDAKIADLQLPSGGFSVKIDQNVVVRGQDALGLRMGLSAVSQLLRAKDGKLTLPHGTIRDWPSNPWRGAHLFVGPEALAFQTKLMDKVLGPAGFNKVVLQCEQTQWDSFPKIWHANSMKKADLKELFHRYRERQIDPIPLIQSLGHMEWFFANGQNRDLVFNPEVPYAIDPAKPEAAKAVGKIWQEAIDLLHPSTLHFGLDEIDMRGFPEGDHDLTTKVWKQGIDVVAAIAKKANLPMMIWGDQGLGPGEAPDAALGDTRAQALARRQAIPKGTLIGDWHYLDNPDPKVYRSLDLWKREGFLPIASGWNRLGNIIGFNRAAIQTGSGYLQTTWAGYFSNEESLLASVSQYSAFLVAGQCAWNGSVTDVASIGFDPTTELYQRMYAPPSVTGPEKGVRFGPANGPTLRIGGWNFRKLDGLATADFAQASQGEQPLEWQLDLDKPCHEIALALQTSVRLDDRQPVGTIKITDSEGKTHVRQLLYGLDVRASGDPSATLRTPRADRLSVVTMTSKGTIKRVQISAANGLVGLTVAGVSGRG